MTDPTLDSLRLSWTVLGGHFDSFVIQFKDKEGPRLVPVEGHKRSVTITPLDTGRKYRFLLYGLLGKKRHGPLTTDGTTGEVPGGSREGACPPARPGPLVDTCGGCHHGCYLVSAPSWGPVCPLSLHNPIAPAI